MLICESLLKSAVLAAALLTALPAGALDEDKNATVPPAESGAAMVAPAPDVALPEAALPAPSLGKSMRSVPSPPKFENVTDALRSFVKNYKEGDKEAARLALGYAADKGNPSARFKLGQMYAAGDGVPQDDLQAFEFFRTITLESGDIAPDAPEKVTVARAFIAVGNYYRDGIPNSDVVPDIQEAYRHYNYAAAYFGDSDAQYNIARLYLDGLLGEKDVTQAARWLKLAADKKHRYAQALLGHLLFYGSGISRQPASGLAWLKLANEGAEGERDQWIRDSYRQADEAATNEIRTIAIKLIEQFKTR
jgi:uncharacterized protein